MDIVNSFIIIDDSELDLYVTQKFLEITHKNLAVKVFQSGHEALEMIRETSGVNSLAPVMIMLDLQMPVMSGFQFVEEFEKLPPEIQKNYRITVLSILSHGKDPADINRILTYPSVSAIMEKPLTKEKLFSLLSHGL